MLTAAALMGGEKRLGWDGKGRTGPFCTTIKLFYQAVTTHTHTHILLK